MAPRNSRNRPGSISTSRCAWVGRIVDHRRVFIGGGSHYCCGAEEAERADG